MMFRVAGQCPGGEKECAAGRRRMPRLFAPPARARPPSRNEKSKFHLSVSEERSADKRKGKPSLDYEIISLGVRTSTRGTQSHNCTAALARPWNPPRDQRHFTKGNFARPEGK